MLIYIHVRTYMSLSFIDYSFPPVISSLPQGRKVFFFNKDHKNKTDVENKKNVKTVEGIIDGVFFSQTVLYLTLTSSATIVSNYAS